MICFLKFYLAELLTSMGQLSSTRPRFAPPRLRSHWDQGSKWVSFFHVCCMTVKNIIIPSFSDSPVNKCPSSCTGRTSCSVVEGGGGICNCFSLRWINLNVSGMLFPSSYSWSNKLVDLFESRCVSYVWTCAKQYFIIHM